MKVFRTPVDRVEVHESGYVVLPGTGFEITALPLMDSAFPGRVARLGHGDKIEGIRLPTTAELDLLRSLSVHIEPVTFPTSEMLRAAGIPAAEAAINAFRTTNMRSEEWCRLHDEECWSRLLSVGWDGKKPCANFGKHWTAGGGIYGWWRSKGAMIQTLSFFHKSEPTYTDYATNVHGVRPVGSNGGPPIRGRSLGVRIASAIGNAVSWLTSGLRPTLPLAEKGNDVARQTIRLGSRGADVQAWQRIVGATADGIFGPGTERLTKVWQEANGLVADGVVGAKSWAAAGERAATALPAGGIDPRAPACVAALRDANARWPGRKKVSDGIMGDARHQASKSDHNLGNAVDITHDPASGCDGNLLAVDAMRDPRVSYIIWNAQIWNTSISPAWRPYKGSNPHRHHVHISVRAEAREDASPWPWAP